MKGELASVALLSGAGPEELLDVDGAAALLGMSCEWVHRKSEDGTLPTRRHGRSVRFSKADLLAWD